MRYNTFQDTPVAYILQVCIGDLGWGTVGMWLGWIGMGWDGWGWMGMGGDGLGWVGMSGTMCVSLRASLLPPAPGCGLGTGDQLAVIVKLA